MCTSTKRNVIIIINFYFHLWKLTHFNVERKIGMGWMWEAYILSSCVWRWVCEEWSNEEYQRKEGKTKREK